MPERSSRRSFLQQTAAWGTLAGVGELGWLSRLHPVSAADADLSTGLVPLADQIEPLVKLIETTPRDDVVQVIVKRIESGLSYRELLAALLLAGVRNVQPRPSVGFKFHAVLVVNSAHLASLASPEDDRWLPLLWTLDNFKRSQADERSKSGWRMAPVDESAVPAPHKAREAFVAAIENWDAEALDAATAGLVRSRGANEVFELMSHYGARDYRSIGHKAIFVANAWRTLQTIGWEFAEPVMRSLAFALVNHTGDPNPARSDLDADRPWRRNQERADAIRENWLDGKEDAGATRELVELFRNGTSEDACDLAVKQINAGISPRSLWDAVFIGSGEMLMKQPGIIGLHTLTTANATHYAFGTSANDRTRRLLLLQNCAFVPMFRESARGRGGLRGITIGELEPEAVEATDDAAAVSEILQDVSRDRDRAARKTLAYLQRGGSPGELVDQARRTIFFKGRDAHDYKFSSAVLEDQAAISPQWRNLFLALSVFNLRGSGDRDAGIVERVRTAGL